MGAFSRGAFSVGSFSVSAFEFVPLPPVAGVVEGMGFKSARDWAHDTADLAFIHQEDQMATELLVTLVTQGFFHGAFHR